MTRSIVFACAILVSVVLSCATSHDPLADKNRPLPPEEVAIVLQRLGVQVDVTKSNTDCDYTELITVEAVDGSGQVHSAQGTLIGKAAQRRIVGINGREVEVLDLVGGQALKGPAAKMFRELGVEPSALAVAQLGVDPANPVGLARGGVDRGDGVGQLRVIAVTGAGRPRARPPARGGRRRAGRPCPRARPGRSGARPRTRARRAGHA